MMIIGYDWGNFVLVITKIVYEMYSQIIEDRLHEKGWKNEGSKSLIFLYHKE